jgi:hypothetical protein
MAHVFHCAINTDPSDKFDTVLARIKEFGNNSKSLRLKTDLFGDTEIQKHGNFILECDDVAQVGDKFIVSNAKVLDYSPPSKPISVDVDALMAATPEQAPDAAAAPPVVDPWA